MQDAFATPPGVVSADARVFCGVGRRLREFIERRCDCGHNVPPGGIAYYRGVSSLAERLAHIEVRMATACHRAGRSPGDVRLMGVSKMHSAEILAEAARAGLTLFGENRVQEFETKRLRLQELRVPDAEVHFIGHLQSNKSARAAELFSAIDSVDSFRLAERLNDAAGKLDKRLPILLEIKLSAEPAKSGIEPGSGELRPLLERLPTLEHLAMRGLMTIAPFDENPDTARACFHQLRLLRDYPGTRIPGH